MSELKRCPFCGGEAEIATAVGGVWVRCTLCTASGQMRLEEEQAHAAWNHRPIEDGLRADLERLRSELDKKTPSLKEAINAAFEEMNNMTQEEFETALEEADGSWLEDALEGLGSAETIKYLSVIDELRADKAELVQVLYTVTELLRERTKTMHYMGGTKYSRAIAKANALIAKHKEEA